MSLCSARLSKRSLDSPHAQSLVNIIIGPVLFLKKGNMSGVGGDYSENVHHMSLLPHAFLSDDQIHRCNDHYRCLVQ